MGRITLYGFMSYDKTLFDDIRVPEDCDKETLIDTIVMESGDLFPYYQQPVFLKRNITNWFNTMLPNFTRMFEALKAEYSPIENYDRYESINDSRTTHTDTDSTHTTHTDTDSTQNGSNTDNIESWAESSGSGGREDKVSAYNSNVYQPEANTTSTNSSTNHNNSNTTGTSLLHNAGKTDGSDLMNGSTNVEDTYTHSARLHGNIGVTTAMAMIQEELELRQYDLYLEIARQFEKRFIKQVY